MTETLRKRRMLRVTDTLIAAIDDRLSARNSDTTLDELVADCVLKLGSLAAKGDTKAAMYIVDRFYPMSNEPAIGRKSLPSPTRQPLLYLDALSRCVVQGKMTSGQAQRLGNLAKPLVIDEQLRTMIQEIEGLKKEIVEMRKSTLKVVR